MPTHVVARAAPGTLLFRTHEEARRLWEELVRCCPDLLALCLMPDHLHLILPDADLDRRVHDALSAYARWRNARRGESGAVFAPRPPPQAIPDAEHLSRTIRYVHLNPDRKGLVHDPLGWPWSTHRDAVGLVARPVIPVRNDAERFHRYVSADPSVNVIGSELPTRRHDDVDLEQIAAAVGAVCRALPAELRERGATRTLAIQAAWLHGVRDTSTLRQRFEIGPSAIFHTVSGLGGSRARGLSPELARVLRVIGDARFPALRDGDLRADWGKYWRLR